MSPFTMECVEIYAALVHGILMELFPVTFVSTVVVWNATLICIWWIVVIIKLIHSATHLYHCTVNLG